MSRAAATIEVPKEPASRRAWLVYQLKLRGLSLRELGRRVGVSHEAIGQAMVMPSSHLEPVIASALGVKVQDLFPERFDRTGRRLHQTRAPKRTTSPERGKLQRSGAL